METSLGLKTISEITPNSFGVTNDYYKSIKNGKSIYDMHEDIFGNLPELPNVFKIKVGEAIDAMNDLAERWYKYFTYILYHFDFDVERAHDLFVGFEMSNSKMFWKSNHVDYKGYEFYELYNSFISELEESNDKMSFDKLFRAHWLYLKAYESLFYSTIYNPKKVKQNHKLYNVLFEFINGYLTADLPVNLDTLLLKIELNGSNTWNYTLFNKNLQDVIQKLKTRKTNKIVVSNKNGFGYAIRELLMLGGFNVCCLYNKKTTTVYWYNDKIIQS